MQILGFDESATIPASLANGAGVATNRNATGPVILTILSSGSGTSYEVHSVNSHPLTVQLPNAEGVVSLGGAGKITLGAGAAVVVRLVAPGVWGLLGSGDISPA